VEWTIQDLGAIGEFVGAFTVVVTLIYLTLQVRQSTAQARLTSIQAVNASNDSAFNPIYIPENARVWALGQEDPDALVQPGVMVPRSKVGEAEYADGGDVHEEPRRARQNHAHRLLTARVAPWSSSRTDMTLVLLVSR